MSMLLTGTVKANDLCVKSGKPIPRFRFRNPMEFDRIKILRTETAMNSVHIQSGRVAFILRMVVMLLFPGFFFTGCATSGTVVSGGKSETLPSSLAGTEWRLVEFQSMDDAQGTARPHDPSLYTMRLNADGSLNMRLNCNRAHGSWKAGQGSDTSNGNFTLGPLAVTKVLCPTPGMDVLVIKQAGYIRSYMLKDGRLYLALMADGGIFVWEPLLGSSSAMKPDAAIESAILRANPSYTSAVVGDARSRYASERVDLNGDGRGEVFVYLMGSFFCGSGGCNLLVLREALKGGYALVNDFSITRLPVIVSPLKSHGWNDIWRMESGGGAKASYVRHSFDGTRYVKRERIAAFKAPQGRACLAGDVTFEKGIPLEPHD